MFRGEFRNPRTALLDANQTYQYHAFGVPQLALKPGLDAEGLVISPYSTMLALPIEPGAAVGNLKRLEELGLVGPMGFYEAIDFTRAAKRQGERGRDHLRLHGAPPGHEPAGAGQHSSPRRHAAPVPRRSAHSRDRIGAVRADSTDAIRHLEKNTSTTLAVARPSTAEEPAERIWKGTSAVPHVHFYGNGRYSLMVTNSGGSYSRWNDLDLSRWRSDTTLDAWGSFLYIRDTRSDALWAAASKPAGSQLGTCGNALLGRSC